MQRRNDQIDMLSSQPFYQAQINQPEIQAKPIKTSINVDHNIGLNDSDLQNLDDMSFESPNVLHDTFLEYKRKEKVQKEMDRLWEIYNKKKNNFKIKSTSMKSKRDGVAEMHSAHYETLKRYKGKLEHLAKNIHFIQTFPPDIK